MQLEVRQIPRTYLGLHLSERLQQLVTLSALSECAELITEFSAPFVAGTAKSLYGAIDLIKLSDTRASYDVGTFVAEGCRIHIILVENMSARELTREKGLEVFTGEFILLSIVCEAKDGEDLPQTYYAVIRWDGDTKRWRLPTENWPINQHAIRDYAAPATVLAAVVVDGTPPPALPDVLRTLLDAQLQQPQ